MIEMSPQECIACNSTAGYLPTQDIHYTLQTATFRNPRNGAMVQLGSTRLEPFPFEVGKFYRLFVDEEPVEYKDALFE